MTTYEPDAYDQTADDGNGILGQHLKCAKGTWLLDGEKIATGTQVCVILTSATTGQILWQDGSVAERDIGRLEDGVAPPREIREGWNPHTSFQVVGANDENFGELMTFTSSSWGGRRALQNLVSMFRLKERRQFPICQLETKERKNDKNGNVDPVFKVIGWSDRANFGELLAPPSAGATAPIIEFKPAAQRTADDDDIPF